VGGIASVSKTESEITTKFDGVIEFDNIKVTEQVEGGAKSQVVLSRSGEIRVVDPETKKFITLTLYLMVQHLLVKDKQKVTKGQLYVNGIHSTT
jgi:DNA-directed RNA polymerase subunit beta'